MYESASPADWASAPPAAGPTTLPSAHAPFIAPKTRPRAIPVRSALSEMSAIPGVKNAP